MRNSILLSTILLFMATACEPSQPPAPVNELDSPAGDHSSLPRLYTDNTGTVFMSWVAEDGEMSTLKYASYANGVWSAPKAVASDSGWFLNWADFPSIIAYDGKPLAAHWLNKREGGTYAYDVNIAAFGGSWSAPVTPHNDNTASEHGFVSMIPVSDSTFYSSWLDGRETAGRGHDDYSDIEQAMTLRAAKMDQDAHILEEYLIDDSVCDCCTTALTKTDKGLVVAYRNRTAGEIRDIYTSRFQDGSWSEPTPIHEDHWEIAACPVNGPAIDASAETVAVAWFTGAGDLPTVKLAISDDYGQSFGTVLEVDSVHTAGRTDLNISRDRIWLSWLSENDEESVLKVRAYRFDGELIQEYSLSGVDSRRSGGFPQISPVDSGLMVAFMQRSEDINRIATRLLKLP